MTGPFATKPVPPGSTNPELAAGLYRRLTLVRPARVQVGAGCIHAVATAPSQSSSHEIGVKR